MFFNRMPIVIYVQLIKPNECNADIHGFYDNPTATGLEMTTKSHMDIEDLSAVISDRLTLIAWWRHQIETFSTLLAWRGALMSSLICAWANN